MTPSEKMELWKATQRGDVEAAIALGVELLGQTDDRKETKEHGSKKQRDRRD